MDQTVKTWLVFIATREFSFDHAENEGDILETPDQLAAYVKETEPQENWDREVDGLVTYCVEAVDRRQALFIGHSQAFCDEVDSKGAVSYALCTTYGYEALND